MSEEEKKKVARLMESMDCMEMYNAIEEGQKKYDNDADEYWDKLSYEDKLKAFYSVCKRIHKGDIKDRGSYRYVLYQVFGFDADAYTIAMRCGYDEIHNSIVVKDELKKVQKENQDSEQV